MTPYDELVNGKQLAAKLGVSTWVTKSIKAAGIAIGDPAFSGRYTTVRRIQEWLMRHPEFVASHWHRHRPKKLSSTEPALLRSNLRREAAGKLGGRSKTRAPSIALPATQ